MTSKRRVERWWHVAVCLLPLGATMRWLLKHDAARHLVLALLVTGVAWHEIAVAIHDAHH